MKVKRLLTAIGLGLFAAASVGVGLTFSRSEPVQEARAEGAASDVTQYVCVAETSWWTGGADSLNIWMYGGIDDGSHDDTWVTTTHLGGDLYKFTFKAGYSKFIVEKAAGETHWVGESFEVIYSDDYNCYNLYKEDGQTKYSYTRHWTSYLDTPAKRTFYVDVVDQASYWHKDSAKTYIYYFGNGIEAKEMTRLTGTNVYRVTINDYYLFKFLIVRSDNFDPSNWSTVWNQTKDILLTNSNENCKWIKLGDKDPSDDNKLNVAGFETVSITAYGEAFAAQFLQEDLCYDAGGLHEDFATNWSAISDAMFELKAQCYSDLSVDLRADYLSTASSVGDGAVARAMKRYDTIRAKHSGESITNFLQRSLVPLSSNGPVMLENKTTTTVIVCLIIVAISSISFAAVLISIKKRKHN